jgi:hypothetical protein
MAALSKEAERLGVVFSGARSQTLGILGDEMDRAEESVRGLWTEISAQLAPSLTKFFTFVGNGIPMLTSWLERNTYIGDAIAWVSKQLGTLINGMLYSAQVFGSVAKSWLGTVGFAVLEIGKRISDLAKKIGLMLNAAASDLVSASTGMGSEFVQKIFGISPEALQQSIDSVRNFAVKLSAVAKDARDTGLDAGAALTAIGKATEVKMGEWVAQANEMKRTVLDMANRVGGLAGMGGSATGGAAAGEAADGAPNSAPKSISRVKAAFEDLHQVIGQRMQSMGRTFTATFASMMKAGKSLGASLKESLLEAVGSQAVSEGTYHFMAGLAQMFAPGQQGQGAMRMARGLALMAFGSAIGGSGESGGGAAGGVAPSADYGNTPGAEVEPEQKRRQLTVVVQGNLFNSRETWSHLAELSQEFSDSDVKFAQGSVALA